MRRKKEVVLSFESCDDGMPKVVRDYRSRYQRFSQILDANEDIFSAIHQDIQGISTGGQIAFSYNRLDERLTAADPATEYTYQYDGFGRIASVGQQIAGLTPELVLAHAHSPTGRRVQLDVQLGQSADLRNEYAYDALQRVARITQSGTGGNAVAPKRVEFSYDDGSQFDTIPRYADTGGTQLVAASAYGFDLAGRLTSLTARKGDITDIDGSGKAWQYAVMPRTARSTEAGMVRPKQAWCTTCCSLQKGTLPILAQVDRVFSADALNRRAA